MSCPLHAPTRSAPKGIQRSGRPVTPALTQS
jgi:hypothetical protein